MSANLSDRTAAAHRLFSEKHLRPMAKADLKKLEIADLRPLIGQFIVTARMLLRWTQQDLHKAIEAATGQERDLAQISRWESGKERPQFDVLLAVEEFRGPLLIAMAEHTPSTEIVTTISIRRPA